MCHVVDARRGTISAVVTALALLSVSATSPVSAQPAATRPVSFTVTRGTWMALDAAPDGQSLLFELLGDVYRLPMAGGTATPMLTGNAWQAQPRFSPDGRTIAYVSDADGSENLWLADATGGHARRLTNVPRAIMLSPAWSPDGATLYATVVEGRTADLWQFDARNGTGTRLVANANGQPSGLVSTPSPGPYGAHLSADGRALYYTSVTPRPYGVRQGATSFVVRRDLATGRDEVVALDEPTAMSPVLSRDGRWLVYAAQSRGRTGLRLRDLAADQERWLAYPIDRNQLEARATRDVVPSYAFHPDSRSVLAAFGGQIHRLHLSDGRDEIIPFTATYATELPAPPTARARLADGPVRGRLAQHVAASPDGRSVAYSMFARLYVADVRATGAPRRLTADSAPREFMPTWSPDGQWVAYTTWTPAGGHLYKVPARGGKAVRLTDTPALYLDPVWSPDGRSVFALRAPLGSARVQALAPLPSDTRLVRVPAGAGAATSQVLAPANGARHPHFTGDTSRVWLSAPTGLVSVPVQGGDARLELRGRGDMRLAPDGRHVLMHAGDRLWLAAVPAASPPGTPATIDMSTATLLHGGAVTGGAWQGSARVLFTTGANLRAHAVGVAAATPVPPSGAAPPVRSLSVALPRVTGTGARVLRGGTAITMRGDEIIRNADIVIENDRITAVGVRGTVAVPAGATVHDVTGTTIVPGIVDVHAHWSFRRDILEPEMPSAFANLAFGVTTIRDPQTTVDIFGYSDLAEVSGVPSPRITSTGPGLFAELDPKSYEDTRAILQRYRDDYGTWLLKSYLIGSRQQRQWVVQASRELGMLPTTEGGADDKTDLTHALDAFTGNEHALPMAPLHDDVVQLMARSGIAYTPTLIVSFGGALPVFRLHATERPADDPKLQRFFPRSELFQRTATRLLAFPDEDYNDRETAAGAAAIARAGGLVALGGHGEMQGLQAHWEMRLLAQGGLNNHEILRVATLNGARAIGVEADVGSVEVGKLADLLVLDRDPLVDIRNTTSLRWVVRGGVVYDAETLDRVAPAPASLPAPWWRSDSPRVGGRTLDPVAVDRVVLEEMRRQQVPGLAVAVLRGNEVALAKGYGLANMEQQVAVSPGTMFQSGSLGKMFTAAGIMALVEDGKVALDSSIRVYLPDAPAAWQRVTIRHLLSHTSGIPDYTSATFDYRRDFTEAELEKLAYTMSLEFPPGTRWNYSNSGYVLLGITISRLTGRPYWEYLRQRLFAPAGMHTVRIISERDIVPLRASGYLPGAQGFEHQSWVSPTLNTTADGSLLISLNDLVAWSRVVRDRAVLSKSSWQQILTPVTLNSGKSHPYGFGWFLDTLNGQRVNQHGGSWQGFRTQFSRFEGSDITVIVLANGGHVAPDAIANRVAAVVDSTLAPVPLPAQPLPGADPKVEAALRAVLGKAAAGSLTATDFEFVRVTTVPRMAAAYARLLSPLGSLQRLELVQDAGPEGDDRVYLFRAVYDAQRVLVRVKIGPGGGVTSLTFPR